MKRHECSTCNGSGFIESAHGYSMFCPVCTPNEYQLAKPCEGVRIENCFSPAPPDRFWEPMVPMHDPWDVKITLSWKDLGTILLAVLAVVGLLIWAAVKVAGYV